MMNNLDINPRIISAVNRAKLDNFGLVLSYSAPDLERITLLSAKDVAVLQKAVAEKVIKHQSVTALQILKDDCVGYGNKKYLSTGCPILDTFLRGGVISPGLTEIAGESASGKTQLCMQLSLMAQLSFKVGGLEGGAVYICTEDVFPNKRLVQMAELLKKRITDTIDNFTDNIFIEHAAEMDDLWHCLKRKVPVLLAQGRVRLVIIDSIAALFRCEYGASGMVKRAKELSSFSAYLHKLSDQFGIPVLCVNQVSDLFCKNKQTGSSDVRKITPALGITWANLVTCRLMLQRTSQHVTINQKNNCGTVLGTTETIVRRIEIMFAPHLPNSMCYYFVDIEGVKGLS